MNLLLCIVALCAISLPVSALDLNWHLLQYTADRLSDQECLHVHESLVPEGMSARRGYSGDCLALLTQWAEGHPSETHMALSAVLESIGRRRLASSVAEKANKEAAFTLRQHVADLRKADDTTDALEWQTSDGPKAVPAGSTQAKESIIKRIKGFRSGSFVALWIALPIVLLVLIGLGIVYRKQIIQFIRKVCPCGDKNQIEVKKENSKTFKDGLWGDDFARRGSDATAGQGLAPVVKNVTLQIPVQQENSQHCTQ